MKKNSLVTICIPSHNNSQDLLSTIQSLLKQSYKPILIKIFDNASSDNTAALAQAIVDENPGFVELELHDAPQDIGLHMSRSINGGVSDFTALFAAGFIYDPTIIEEQVRLFEQFNDLGAVLTHAQKIDPAGMPLGKMRIPPELQVESSKLLRYEELFGLICQHGDFLISQSLFARSHVLRDDITNWNYGHYKMAAGLDVILRVAQVTQIAFLNKPLVQFQYPKTQTSKDNLSGRTSREDLILVIGDHLEKLKNRGLSNDRDVQNYKFLIFRDQVFRTRNAIVSRQFNKIPRWSPWQWTILKSMRLSRWHFETAMAGWGWYFIKIFLLPLVPAATAKNTGGKAPPLAVYVSVAAHGSTGRYVEALMRPFLEAHKSIALITSLDHSDDQFRKFLKNNKVLNRRTINVKLKKEVRFLEITKIWKIYTFLKNKNIRFIHGIGPKGGAIARFLAWMLECPSIYSPMGGGFAPKFKSFQFKFFIKIEKIFAPATSGLIFESTYMQKAYLKYVGASKAKSTICPPYNLLLAASKDHTSKPRTSERWIIGHFSKDWNSQENFELFLQSIKILVDQDVAVDVRVHNEGSCKAKLEKSIKKLGLNERVHLLGEALDETDLIEACDVMIFTTERSSFDWTQLHAMALGVPVVAPLDGGFCEWIENEKTGLLYSPHSAQSLAKCLTHLHGNKALSDSISKAAAIKIRAEIGEGRWLLSIQNLYLESGIKQISS